MSPTGIHMNKTAAGLIIGVIAAIAVVFTFYERGSIDLIKMSIPNTIKTWKTKPFVEIPADAKSDLDKVAIHTDTVKLSVDGKDVNVFYQEAGSDKSKLSVLVLHGAAFTSQTWVNPPMKSLQILSKLGYRAVAIDLPGSGKSEPAVVDKVAYMEALITALKLQAPVIISPSMSGGYSLPYLFKDPENVLKRAKGFVPVAPVNTNAYSPEKYRKLQIPTMHICGDKDTSIGVTARKHLQDLPNYELFMLKDARHPAYLDQPDMFHKYLYNFLLALEGT